MTSAETTPNAARDAGQPTFTSGPWHVEPAQFDEGRSLVICKARQGIIATIHAPAPDDLEDGEERAPDADFTREEDEANARLMAASPVLFAVAAMVEKLERSTEGKGMLDLSALDLRDLYTAARAALRLATEGGK